MLKKEEIAFIPGTPAAVRAYSIKDYRPHWHSDCLEVVFILKGRALVLASYDRFQLEEGDCVVLNESDIHYIHGEEDNLILSLYIDLFSYEKAYPYIRYLNFICESFNLNRMQEQSMEELRKLILMVIMEASEQERDLGKIVRSTDRIVELLVYKFDMVHYYNGRDIPEDQLLRYHRMMKEIEEKYGEKMSLEALAEKESIGRNYASQFWKKMTNMNFTEYLNSRRSEKAEMLLLTTEKSISEISLLCGFSDPKYIYKSFKKWYDVTPSAHKKTYEQYIRRGEAFEEYDGRQLLRSFGRNLVDAFADENQSWLLRTAGLQQNWREQYEYQMRKYSASRIKKEMLRESLAELGVKELHLPLLDPNTAAVKDGEMQLDSGFIQKVLQHVKERGYILHIEMNVEERGTGEWETVFAMFVSALEESGRELMGRCRFDLYFSRMEKAEEVRELAAYMARFVDAKYIRPALRFTSASYEAASLK